MARKKLKEIASDYTRPGIPNHIFDKVGSNFICPRCGYVLGTCNGQRPPCGIFSPEEIKLHTEAGIKKMESILEEGKKLYENN